MYWSRGKLSNPLWLFACIQAYNYKKQRKWFVWWRTWNPHGKLNGWMEEGKYPCSKCNWSFIENDWIAVKLSDLDGWLKEQYVEVPKDRWTMVALRAYIRAYVNAFGWQFTRCVYSTGTRTCRDHADINQMSSHLKFIYIYIYAIAQINERKCQWLNWRANMFSWKMQTNFWNEKMSWTQTLTKLEPASLVNVTSLVCNKNIENRKLIIEV